MSDEYIKLGTYKMKDGAIIEVTEYDFDYGFVTYLKEGKSYKVNEWDFLDDIVGEILNE